jgi:hypothetical protein
VKAAISASRRVLPSIIAVAGSPLRCPTGAPSKCSPVLPEMSITNTTYGCSPTATWPSHRWLRLRSWNTRPEIADAGTASVAWATFDGGLSAWPLRTATTR